MKEKLFLLDGERGTYLINQADNPETSSAVGFGVVSCCSKPIKGHWIIEVNNYPYVHEIIGFVHNEAEIPNTTYDRAREFAQKLAETKNLPFVDATKRTQMSQLEHALII